MTRAQGRAGPLEAQPMLHRYLEATLEGLGPLKLPERDLLEKHLVARDGSRTLLRERQALEEMKGLGLSKAEALAVLTHLEGHAVLRAEAHQGGKYYELGHDWLATKVLEQRKEREQEEAARQQREEQERREQEAARKLRRWALLAGGAVVVAVVMVGVMLWAVRQRRAAEGARSVAEKARVEAEEARVRASVLALVAGVREQLGLRKPEVATQLLVEVKRPEQMRGWQQLALDTLVAGVPRASLRCRVGGTVAKFSPDGKLVVTASEDKTAGVWPVSIPALQQALREANVDCLPPETRQIYLDEAEVQAQERYLECERSQGRPPFFAVFGPP